MVVAGIIVNARDVTERRQAEDELVRSHHLLEAIIEGTTDTIFVKDVDGRCLMINAAGASLLGREKREVIGKLLECKGTWCRLQVGGRKGWLPRDQIWGVYPTEVVK